MDRHFLRPVILSVLFALITARCSYQTNTISEFLPVGGSQAPIFVGKTLDGKKISLASYQGHPVLINFWASWCSPCRKEFPELLALYEKYKDHGLQIVGISIDDRTNKWIGAIRKDKLTWPQFIDEGPPFGGKASRLFNIRSLPSTFLVNDKGVIIAENVTIDQIKNTVSRLLDAKKNN